MALSRSLSGFTPTNAEDFANQATQVRHQQAMMPLQQEQAKLQIQSAQDELAGKRRGMAISMLSGIMNEADPAKQASLYSTLRPMAERYDPTLILPEQFDPSTVNALYQSQISPKDRLAQSVELQKAQMMAEQRNAMLDLKQQSIDQQAELAGFKREEKRQTENDKAAERYSNTIDKNGITDLLSAVNNATTALAPYTDGKKDIPGFGPLAGMLPEFAVSQAGKDLRQTYASVRNAVLKARSGGAVTDGEAARLLQELGEGTGIPDSQVIKGINNVSGFLRNRIQNIQAGYSPEAIDVYTSRGGNTTVDAVTDIRISHQTALVAGRGLRA